MKIFLPLLVFVLFYGCTKDQAPLVPVEIAITSKSGILEIHYTPNKVDTLTKAQGATTIQVIDGDYLRIKRICPEKEALQYNIKTVNNSYLSILLKDGDSNTHAIHAY